MTRQPTVDAELTIVIPTLGRDILRRCLASMAAGTVWPARIIVVDQASRAEVRDMLGELQDTGLQTLWLPSRERGRSAGVNRGIEAAATRFVAVTDDDCLAAPDWAERMGARLRATPEAIVTGRVEAGDDLVISVVTDTREMLQRRPSLRFDRLSGGNMGAARSLLLRIGLLDEDPCLRTAEDAELAYRALRSGIPILYAPDIAIVHLGWRDDEGRSSQYEDYARSHGGFFGKYLRRGDWFIAARTLVHGARALRRWLVGSVRGQAEIARNGRAYVTGLIPGIRAGWQSFRPHR
jgi:GT2 family glycosyltransferase